MGLSLITYITKRLFRASGEKNSKGLKHWYYQKISALVMIPLTLWFLIKLPFFISLSYNDKLEWLIKFPNFLMIILFYIAASLHMKLGLTVVIEDYLHNERIKFISLAIIKIFSFVLPVIIIVLVLILRG